MDGQQVAALSVVAVAAGLLIRGAVRRRRSAWSGKAPCGCGEGMLRPQGSILFRARKGERSQIIVRGT